MIHASTTCTDSCLLYDVIDSIILDLRDRLKTPAAFVFLSTDNVSCDISTLYCQQMQITYNAVDPKQSNMQVALSELNIDDTILLAIPYIATPNVDDTMRLVDTMLRSKRRVIVLHNYQTTSKKNMKENIVYYNF